MFSHLQESRPPSHVTVSWNDKRHHSWHPPLPSSSSFMCWPWCHMEWDIPRVTWGQLSCPCPLSQLLVHPQPTRWWVGWDAEKALMLCKHCSATVRTSLCYQHCLSSNPKLCPYQLLGKKKTINSTPAQPAQFSSFTESGFSIKIILNWSCSI